MRRELLPAPIAILGTIIASLAMLMGCGSTGAINGGMSFAYHLERAATNLKTNKLLLNLPSDYLVKITGEGFTADVAKDTLVPPRAAITLNYELLGSYEVGLTISQPDGTEIISDTLTWDYDLETPPDPIVSFSEEATADQQVFLLVSTARGPGIQELWVEGDLDRGYHPEGSWYTIPATSKVAVLVSSEDGLKKLTVRYRNQFGSESAPKTLEILKKSVGPTSCRAMPIAATSKTTRTKVKLWADNDGELTYFMRGDIDGKVVEGRFSGETVVDLDLSAGEGPKAFVVGIADLAGNACDNIDLDVTVDGDYQSASLAIEGEPIWTDDTVVSILPHIDHFPDEAIEVYVSGDVESGPSTFQWLPLADALDVELMPTNGMRHVYVEFRDAAGKRVVKPSASVYLAPYVSFVPSSSPPHILVSNIVGLEGFTVTGCSETYVDETYDGSIPCTAPTGTTISVRYDLVDGTSITRQTTAP